jgi:hypothetical protein
MMNRPFAHCEIGDGDQCPDGNEYRNSTLHFLPRKKANALF